MDIYEWILSPEIRDYLRETYPMSVQEKAEIICNACRCIEDKYSALCTLSGEAETEEDKEVLEDLIRLYQWGLEELRRVRPGQIFTCGEVVTYGDVKFMQEEYRVDRMFYTWEEAVEYLEDLEKNCDPESGNEYFVEKWAPDNNNIEEIVYVNFCVVSGTLQAVMFWPMEDGGSHKFYEKLGIRYKAKHLHEWPGLRNEIPIPFESGDLVRLDAPNLEETVYGVLYKFDIPSCERFLWFFYIQNGSLAQCSFNGYAVGGWSIRRVLDWLYPASVQELPPDQKILGEIGMAFSRAGQNTDEGELLFDKLINHINKSSECQ